MQLKSYLHRVSFGFLIFASFVGCTDSRSINPVTQALNSGLIGRAVTMQLIPQRVVQFQGNTTITEKIFIKGSSLVASGKPFGLSIWDVGSDPLSPILQYAYQDNINAFSQLGGWTPDYYASGAMASLGRYLLTSGVAGSSLVDILNPANAVELLRYPPRSLSDQQTPQDPFFVYNAVVTHPTQLYFYGFTQQMGYSTLNLNSYGLVPSAPNQLTPYSNSGGRGTCCAMGGTVFQNNAFVAFRSHLRQFVFGSGNSLQEAAVINALNAVNVVSTPDYLFIQHAAVPGNTYPSGIYVINSQGTGAAFISYSPKVFAVSSDSNYLYANENDVDIRIYQINWSQLNGIPF
jgi:hypothetical protein